ncbi:MAG: dTDP-glucose 4,6-dehydratase [Thermodesulfobacteriota bacterium]
MNPPLKKILVTGGAGFIGTNFIRYALRKRPDWLIYNLDALTYAGNPSNLSDLSGDAAERYRFFQEDIRHREFLDAFFQKELFDGVFHFAAESHVDRSILGPEAFVETNVLGTFRLLEASLAIWKKRQDPDFRFLHVSTDEVYGSLGEDGFFTETTPYDPSSPYSASKAGSDHLVKAYHRTYGLPVLVTNCSNNYGPYQFPEKLIPLMILHIIERKTLPVYGDGGNIRDWLFVEDHCEALIRVFENGRAGETYNIGGSAEYRNLEIVHTLCRLLDKRLNRGQEDSRQLIRLVADRPGHDRRYAIDATKIRTELGWTPQFGFEDGIKQTVEWYLTHMDWVDSVRSGKYREWIEANYTRRDKGE